MDALYVEHDGKIGVLSSDERKVVSQVIGTDLTLVYDKKEGNTYLLIPLTRNHKFECKSSHIIVDGKRFDSDIFFRKDEGGATVYRMADGGRTYNKSEAMTATDVQFVLVMANQGWRHAVISI